MVEKFLRLFFIGLMSNIALGLGLYISIGSRISLILHSNQAIIISLVILITIIILIISKILEMRYNLDAKKLTLTGFSTIMYSLLSINLIQIIKLIYNVLNYEDIIVNNKYFSIIFHYTKNELAAMISVFYKQITGTARIFNMQEEAIILNNAKSASDVKKNLKEFLLAEQKINIESTNYLTKGLSFISMHPYITLSILGTISIFLGVSIYRHYSNIIHWHQTNKNMNSVSIQVQKNTEHIGETAERMQKLINVVKTHDDTIRTSNSIVKGFLGAVGELFQVGIEITTEKGLETKVNIKPQAVIKFLKQITILVTESKNNDGVLEGNSEEKQIIFRPFTGTGHKLGTKEKRENEEDL